VKAPSAEVVAGVAKEQPASGARAAADNPAVVAACPEVVVAAEEEASPAVVVAGVVAAPEAEAVAAVAADADKRGADYEKRTEKIKGERYESTSLYKER
jgi:hypothetical protein